jgi:Cu/Zn superoxide dismutase
MWPVLVCLALALALAVRRPRRARCVVRAQCAREDARVHGTIRLADAGTDRTRATCELRGLTPGAHGLHVHRCGDLSGGCASTCDHYNPSGARHGGATGPHRPRGDFGNVWADAAGVCTTEVVADVDLAEIVGRAFVVHAGEDDLGRGGDDESTRTGNAGARLAGGLIRWA